MTKTFAVATMAAMAAFGGIAESRADDFHQHIDEVSFDLMRQSAALAREVRYGYRHHPEFDHLYGDVVEMYQCANHIHEIAHHTNCLGDVKRDAAKLDELFHHVEDVLAETERTSRFANRFHRDRALRIMGLMNETLHHLLDDLDLACGGVAAPPAIPAPVVPGPGLRNPVVPNPVLHGPIVPRRPVIVTPTRPVRWEYQRGGGFTYRSNNGRFAFTIRH